MSRRLLGSVVAWVALAPTALACTADELGQATDAAVAAWSQQDLAAFRSAREAMAEHLACQTEVLSTDAVRDVHLTGALSAYLPPRDPDRVEAAFRALLSVDPGFALSEAIAPPGNLLHDLLEQARAPDPAAAASVQALGASEGCTVLVDGREASFRTTARPVLLQLACAGSAKANVLLPPDAPLPIWAQPPPPAVEPLPLPPTDPEPDREGRPALALAIGGGASLVAGAAVLANARGWKDDYELLVADIPGGGLADEEAPDVELARTRANRRGYVAQGLGLAGAGLVTAAVVVHF